ncbi:hypothetical protein, partial [Vibrio parahaemolyticus]|uniref:hypothetical protein n=1 Tax=Vibrio parahaemolyticus TaxID=670 RepID=UPI001EEC94D5
VSTLLQQAIMRSIAQQIIPALCGFACLPKGGSVSKSHKYGWKTTLLTGSYIFLRSVSVECCAKLLKIAVSVGARL